MFPFPNNLKKPPSAPSFGDFFHFGPLLALKLENGLGVNIFPKKNFFEPN